MTRRRKRKKNKKEEERKLRPVTSQHLICFSNTGDYPTSSF
jgi:hypothetical protein